MTFLNVFREFAVRGNVVDMAVGIIVGSAFTLVVQSFVKNVFMPPLAIVTGDLNFENRFAVLREGTAPGPYATPEVAQTAGALTLNYGSFLNAVISLVIVAFAAFLMVRAINRLHKKAPPPDSVMRACPFCITEIPKKASRCPSCTSEVSPVA